MNIDLNLYRIFYVVAKKGNITKAAEELYISQPAVTQAIHSLENQIGATLFIRAKKGVTLTEEAKVLFQFVESGLNYIQNGENNNNTNASNNINNNNSISINGDKVNDLEFVVKKENALTAFRLYILFLLTNILQKLKHYHYDVL